MPGKLIFVSSNKMLLKAGLGQQFIVLKSDTIDIIQISQSKILS